MIYSYEKYDERYLASGLRGALGADSVRVHAVALSMETVHLAAG